MDDLGVRYRGRKLLRELAEIAYPYLPVIESLEDARRMDVKYEIDVGSSLHALLPQKMLRRPRVPN